MSLIVQSVPLGSQWPTLDPFLFCAHHLDRFPVADGALGPRSAIGDRQIGSDFSGRDGWNLYHGAPVAGFPKHPHRGFETLTWVRRGWCDHADSLGARARFGPGDAQWITAGSGIVHSEMFPLFDTVDPNANELQLFQIWINLPAANKLVDAHFQMMWHEQIPTVITADGKGAVSLIVGDAFGESAPTPPPSSWAAGETDVAVWHLRLESGGEVELPPASSEASRVLYLYVGTSVTLNGESVAANTGVVVDPTRPIAVRAQSGAAECMVLQGRPIAEPVAQRGPFVMNHESELDEAMASYRRTQFGGWPWPQTDPTHGMIPRRFVQRDDVEELRA